MVKIYLQEFVDHIKDNHRDIVDEEVLNSLERDLQKSRKKAGKVSPAKTAKSPPAATKKSVEKPKPKPKPSKATPGKSKAAGPGKSPASRKSRVSMGDGGSPQKKGKEAVCTVCSAVLAKSTPSEITRHMNSRACRAFASEKKSGATHVAETEVDPLDVDAAATNGVRQNDVNKFPYFLATIA
jgi:hypothetical protein